MLTGGRVEGVVVGVVVGVVEGVLLGLVVASVVVGVVGGAELVVNWLHIPYSASDGQSHTGPSGYWNLWAGQWAG